jgi:succinate dehydrogenase/fumarate reductase flavoprotein subunit
MGSQWDEAVDVVVVGSGGAGCGAAIGASLHGARSVLVLERDGHMSGGTTRLAGGGWVWVPRNAFLRKLGVEEPVDDVVALMRTWAERAGAAGSVAGSSAGVDELDAEVMRAFVVESESVFDTLAARGMFNASVASVRDDEDRAANVALLRAKAASDPAGPVAAALAAGHEKALAEYLPSFCGADAADRVPTGKTLQPSVGGSTIKQLMAGARSFPGVELRQGARVIELLLSGVGAVEGVVVEAAPPPATAAAASGSGSSGAGGARRYRVCARGGVVLCSGGFSSNAALLAARVSPGVRGSCAALGCTGDAVELCARINVPSPRLDLAWLKQCVLPVRAARQGAVFFFNIDSGFIVDAGGARFANEKDHYQDRALDMLRHPERRVVFAVFDERARTKYAGPMRAVGGPVPSKELQEDCVVSGEGPEELAENVAAFLRNLDLAEQQAAAGAFDARRFAAGLARTLPRFNAFAQAGVDEDFGRGSRAKDVCWHLTGHAKDNPHPSKTMMPLQGSVLHCLVLGVSTLDTNGGPRTNGRAQLLDARGDPVPGLFGAGNCVQSAANHCYWSSGCTISHAVTFGFVGGRGAAQLLGGKSAKL